MAALTVLDHGVFLRQEVIWTGTCCGLYSLRLTIAMALAKSLGENTTR